MQHAVQSNLIPSLDSDSFGTYSYSDYSRTIKNLSSFKFSMHQFIASYDNLPVDEFMKDNGKYRFRRFARFLFNDQTDTLKQVDTGSFYQSKTVNHLNGDIARNFAEIEEGMAQNYFLKNMILFHLKELAKPQSFSWHIYVHQIRIIGKHGIDGNPTPEGIHQDGHDYVAQILLNRKWVNGGKSIIYNNNKLSIFEKTLKNTLDTILVNDREVYHSVTPINSNNPNQQSYRDMLLIDFNKVGSEL